MGSLTLETALIGESADELTMSRDKLCKLLAASFSQGRGAGRLDVMRQTPREDGREWPESQINPFLGGPRDDR